jgi:hypothetical protein
MELEPSAIIGLADLQCTGMRKTILYVMIPLELPLMWVGLVSL